MRRTSAQITRLIGLFVFCLLPLTFSPPVSAADKVVGGGTPASCTRDALAAQLAGGGTITFNCGPGPVSITIASTLPVTAAETTIDGGGTITLQGVGTRIFLHESYGVASRLTLRSLTLAGGRAVGVGTAANGAAIISDDRSAAQDKPPVLTLEGVTLRDNDTQTTGIPGGRDAYDYGGAIYARGALVAVRDSSFVDNDAQNGAGGAIHILQSGLTIERSSFTNNTAIGARPQDSLGGAIYIDGLGGPSGLFRVTGSRFVNNRAYNSGGAIHVNMYENSTRAEIVDSSFEGNAVVGGTRAQGGAIGGGGTQIGDQPATTGNPQITISGSLFTGNMVRRTAGAEGNPREDGSGGALAFPQRARLSIVNSTFQGNRASGSGFNANGGALYVVNNTDRFSIVSSTFADNWAGWVGGAVSNSQISGQPGGEVRNSLFVNNTADNGPNDWNIQQHCSSELAHDGTNLQYPPRLTGGNFRNDVTCFAGKSAPEQTGDPLFRDPQLAALADNGGPTRTMAIGLSSPALNAGSNCPATDQRGVSRPQAGGCDLGAFELVVQLGVSRGVLAVGDANRTVLVTGFGFTAASVVQVGGQDRPTTYVDGRTLRADLAAGDLASPGTLAISVRGPGADLPAATIVVAETVYTLWLPAVVR